MLMIFVLCYFTKFIYTRCTSKVSNPD